MNMEQNMEEVELEIFEVEEATVMEEMGASIGKLGCCSSIIIR
ncbi:MULTISPECIES: thiopeptide-type bacteriocin [Sutcliffiella]|nr:MULTISPECIES: thiopeptide-type bacteriocin [Sutcliffiella]WBL16834.1 hypothetical protein O1A01_09435 [Sutcliffiella sp. NC1]